MDLLMGCQNISNIAIRYQTICDNVESRPWTVWPWSVSFLPIIRLENCSSYLLIASPRWWLLPLRLTSYSYADRWYPQTCVCLAVPMCLALWNIGHADAVKFAQQLQRVIEYSFALALADLSVASSIKKKCWMFLRAQYYMTRWY